MRATRVCLSTALLLAKALAHGDHSGGRQKPVVDDDADWLTRHMTEEHHIVDFDADSVFTLHDFDGDGQWSAVEIERTYGLHHEDGDGDGVDVDPGAAAAEAEGGIVALRATVVAGVLALFDTDGDGRVSRSEWRDGCEEDGKVLPDMGTGPGHHGDDEYEYEIHHWEKYHDENTKLEDLTHPEDIAHFQHHERVEAEEAAAQQVAEERAQTDTGIIFDNVPAAFRRRG